MSNTVNITQATRIVNRLIESLGAQARILIQGAPGTAKSSIVQQIADSLGYTICDVRAAQKAPEDISGYSVHQRRPDALCAAPLVPDRTKNHFIHG